MRYTCACYCNAESRLLKGFDIFDQPLVYPSTFIFVMIDQACVKLKAFGGLVIIAGLGSTQAFSQSCCIN